LHQKIFFLVAGILVYYGILYGLAVFRPGEGFSASSAMLVLIEVPGAVLAIYLTMDMVAGERDRDTLEILFSTSSSHYRIWAIRLVAVFSVLGASLITMSGLAYVLFAEFPFVWAGLNAFLPAFLICGLTFYFSVACRSSNAAAMLALGCLVLVLLTHTTMASSPFAIFLNPFDPPPGTDDALWDDRVLLNRLSVVALGIGLIGLGLRKMKSRERLLS
ncbi:MAG: ABC transporter permease subunit, partial [bacterium]|nr:ABC transporter permease subunit [bacterium]